MNRLRRFLRWLVVTDRRLVFQESEELNWRFTNSVSIELARMEIRQVTFLAPGRVKRLLGWVGGFQVQTTAGMCTRFDLHGSLVPGRVTSRSG